MAQDVPGVSSEGGADRDPEETRREIRRSIRRLQSESCRGIWALSLFLVVSIAALWDFQILPSLPPGLRTFLGHAPASNWISLALFVYSFSAVILTLGRIVKGRGGLECFSHVGYLTATYGFYHFAGALRRNFWAVFLAGLIILGLSAYGVWTQAAARIRTEKDRLVSLGDAP